MTARRRSLGVFAAGLCLAAVQAGSQPASGDGPQFENGTDLVLPADYRSWPFIGAGLGMTYDGERGTQAAGPDNPRFTHAFVNPTAYAHFMRTGGWPDGTVFMLEFRASQTRRLDQSCGPVCDAADVPRSRGEGRALLRRLGVLRLWPRRSISTRRQATRRQRGRALRRVPFRACRRRADVRAVLSALARSRAREGYSQAGPLSRTATERFLAAYELSRMMCPTPVDEAGT